MTDIEKKALALVNEVTPYECVNTSDACHNHILKALYRAIEQHEAFKQEVSDAVEGYASMVGLDPKRYFARFIIAKPDPLVDALLETFPRANGAEGMAADLRAALAARGLEVRKIGEGE